MSKNPFDALGDDGEEVVAAPVKKDVKEVKKPAAAPAKSSSTSAAPSKDAPKSQGSQGRPPRREFERHSGTGRGRRADGAEDKRGGSGKYNWGTKDSGTTLNDENGADLNESRELTEEEKAAAEAAAEARRKEEAQMSLDEYLKLKQQEKDESERLEVRKAETVDMKGLKLKSEESETVWTIGDDDKSGKGGKSKKSGRKATAITDVSFSIAPVDSSPSSGGGRGRGRGGGSRGGDFRPRSGGGGGGGAGAQAPAVSLADSAMFPSLG